MIAYQHPLYERISKIIVGGDYITTDSGTGLVHTAPGHGQEDYLTGLREGLPLLSPVNDLGKFTEEAGERFVGKSVLGEGNDEVIVALKETGTLIKAEDYNHKYPYDWRTKKPTIFRATEQWFASVSTFREQALKCIDEVEWVPAVGKNRIVGMTESRGDWCISRWVLELVMMIILILTM
jgi:isoleucyl-tRNA synthetase